MQEYKRENMENMDGSPLENISAARQSDLRKAIKSAMICTQKPIRRILTEPVFALELDHIDYGDIKAAILAEARFPYPMKQGLLNVVTALVVMHDEWGLNYCRSINICADGQKMFTVTFGSHMGTTDYYINANAFWARVRRDVEKRRDRYMAALLIAVCVGIVVVEPLCITGKMIFGGE